jgi:hypothetical protein
MHTDVRDLWHLYSEPLEGRVSWMYRDVKGLVTTAVGVLIDPIALAVRLPWRRVDGGSATVGDVAAEWRRVKALPPGLHAAHYRGDVRLTAQSIDDLVQVRLRANDGFLRGTFDAWDDWPADAQLGTLSLAWAVGADLGDWPKFKTACRARRWRVAAIESQIQATSNPGIVPRNEAQRICFRNAARVERAGPELKRSNVYWPLELIP